LFAVVYALRTDLFCNARDAFLPMSRPASRSSPREVASPASPARCGLERQLASDATVLLSVAIRPVVQPVGRRCRGPAL
jgi:hypothetical protein